MKELIKCSFSQPVTLGATNLLGDDSRNPQVPVGIVFEIYWNWLCGL